MPLSWQDKLDAASTEGEVVSIAKDFVAQYEPQEIEALPKPCRPGKFFEAEDVTSYAFALMRHQCDEKRETSERVHKLAAFFSNASTRLSHIMARPNADENGSNSRQSA